jgi:hypothetical protein
MSIMRMRSSGGASGWGSCDAARVQAEERMAEASSSEKR